MMPIIYQGEMGSTICQFFPWGNKKEFRSEGLGVQIIQYVLALQGQVLNSMPRTNGEEEPGSTERPMFVC